MTAAAPAPASAILLEAARHLRELAAPVPREWRLVRSQIIAVGTDRLDGTDVIGECQVRERAVYVASMHPGVALAVADLLETSAGCGCEEGDDHWPEKAAALKVARACLAATEGTTA